MMPKDKGPALDPARCSYGIGPVEAPIGDKLRELHGYLNETADVLAAIDSKLVGPDADARLNPVPLIEPPAIEHMVQEASTKAACITGQAKTILNRL
jgi:hypothetical protein